MSVRMLRMTALIGLIANAACRRQAQPENTVAALRDSLIRIGAEDQLGRDSLAIAIQKNDTVFLKRMRTGDSLHTLWLQRVLASRGWPKRSQVGDSAAAVAWLIVQHTPTDDFQQQALAILQRDSMRDEVKPSETAMLFDRVQSHRHQPQRYGTQFSLEHGILVADPLENLRALDSLRASVGLPPIDTYVKMLAAMYHVPAEWPPASGKHVGP